MILDNAKTIFGIVTGLSGACLLMLTILSIVGECEDPKSYDSFSDKAKILFKKGIKISLWIFIPFLLLTSFLPNSKQAAIIFTAGSTIEYVQNNEKVQELPDKAVDCLNKFIDDYLNEDEER
jgi:hypothetical protein